MTLKDAQNYFENLKDETIKKSEIKVYDKFIYILSELKKRELSKEEIQSLETELESYHLESNPENSKKYFKKALSKFEKYLKDTFSLTSKGYYSSMGIGLGSSFGILFGVIFLSGFERSLGIALGLIIGMLIGLVIGNYMDSQTKAAGNLL